MRFVYVTPLRNKFELSEECGMKYFLPDTKKKKTKSIKKNSNKKVGNKSKAGSSFDLIQEKCQSMMKRPGDQATLKKLEEISNRFRRICQEHHHFLTICF